jgi:hypothetical protein
MGFRDWFVTAAHHREVCALYEQRLVVAADMATRAEERAAREVEIRQELEKKLVDSLFAKPEKVEQRPRLKPSEKTERVQVPLSLDDPASIIRQAVKEVGGRNGNAVAARAQRIMDNLNRGRTQTRTAVLKMPERAEAMRIIEDATREAEAEAYQRSVDAAAAAREAAS